MLDLLPEHSFVGHLAETGLRPLVVDWDEPGPEERRFDLSDYVAERLDPAFEAGRGVADAPIAVIGYCMGGLLALALALRRRREVACLALVATPWDFHAKHTAPGRLLGVAADRLAASCGAGGTVPVDLLQSLFLLLDPFAAERKFVRFAGLDPESAAARAFVALEASRRRRRRLDRRPPPPLN
jgi:polyhydroxyalkanoate synthase